MIDIAEKIARLRLERDWSEFELSKRSNVPLATISSWYRVNQIPTVPTLEKICKAFGMTLSLFFSEAGEPVVLPAEQKELLEDWGSLNAIQQRLIAALVKTLIRK